MGFYQYKTTQLINGSEDEVWDFISSPANLREITPDYMGFDITTPDLPGKMYKGIIISYKVRPLLGIPVTWVTEITEISEKRFFIDQQRIGPYAFWHHQHFIEPSGSSTLMTDIVSYKPPFGLLGSVANYLIISNKIREIFEYRKHALEIRFPKSSF
jgi:ligand-binding SRPBCC domain-containing protein